LYSDCFAQGAKQSEYALMEFRREGWLEFGGLDRQQLFKGRQALGLQPVSSAP
jgi:hypothetical protein